jgi:hypothetical protein
MDGDSRGFPPGDLRVSDAERDRAVSELSRAFQVGRITAGEFDERSGQALRARTGRELIALFADLPPDQAPATGTALATGAPPAPGTAPATGAIAPRPGDQAIAVPAVIGASAVTAALLFLTAISNALASSGPTIQQQEFARHIAASRGLPVPPFTPAPGFDLAGTVGPAAIALLLVALIGFLRVMRADRPA